MSVCHDCSLVWLNPRPVNESVALLYEQYYTHEGLTNEFLLHNDITFDAFPRNKKIKYAVLATHFGFPLSVPFSYRILGKILGMIPSFRKKVESSIGGFSPKHGAKLLDLGCGNGDYLLEMKYLGYNVEGIEIDPHAAEIARSNDLSIVTGTLTKGLYPENSFDAIYLNNVIEHLDDPQEVVSLCYSLLKKGGRLCIKTCSSTSLAHTLYKQDYRGLEIPRHFFIFSPNSLRTLGVQAGFFVRKQYTMFNGYIWAASRAIKKGDTNAAYATENKVLLMLHKILVATVTTFLPDRGDDIFILFEK